jgi:hypothetical protein
MKLVVPVIALATLVLSGCNHPASLSPEQVVANYLTKNGLHVVDTAEIVNYERGTGGQSSTVVPPSTLCFSAPNGVAYRAYDATGHTVQGVACIEKDNTITVVLQRVIN